MSIIFVAALQHKRYSFLFRVDFETMNIAYLCISLPFSVNVNKS